MPMKPSTSLRPHPGRSSATLILAALAMLAVCSMSLAQGLSRNIPDEAKRATIRYAQDMIVTLNSTPMRLAPGAQVRDRNNYIIVPSALPPDGALAEFMTDADGNVSRVWLLTAEEAARTKGKAAAQ